MQFDKQQVLSMISDPSQAEQAAQQLPDTVDHEEHGQMLQKFGVDPSQLAGSSQDQPGGSAQAGPSDPGSDVGGAGTSADQSDAGDGGEAGGVQATPLNALKRQRGLASSARARVVSAGCSRGRRAGAKPAERYVMRSVFLPGTR